MDIDSFLAKVSEQRLQMPSATVGSVAARAPETVDAMFHLPLLAVAIMTIARSGPFFTDDLGRRVALLLVETFDALKHSPHALDMSLTLRRRSVSALVLLEGLGLVTVDGASKRLISLTPVGKSRLDHARREPTDLGALVRNLRTKLDRAAARTGIQ